ncbi:response regulator [Jhaorihella thermophila]
MDDSDIFSLPHHMPTPSRPLMGWTILVVEDSLYASDAVRLLCLRSGARIRRADCLASARRHLQVYRPSAIIVDLGLPDGSGLGLIAELNAAVPRIPVIIAVSGEDTVAQAALDAGGGQVPGQTDPFAGAVPGGRPVGQRDRTHQDPLSCAMRAMSRSRPIRSPIAMTWPMPKRYCATIRRTPLWTMWPAFWAASRAAPGTARSNARRRM